MSTQIDPYICHLIEHATDEELLIGLARRGKCTTRRLASGATKLSLEIREPKIIRDAHRDVLRAARSHRPDGGVINSEFGLDTGPSRVGK